MSNRPLAWLIRGAVSLVVFLAGVIAQPILVPSILPWAEPVGVAIAELIYGDPPSEWKTDKVGGCIAGDIGSRAATAEREGVLLEIGRYTDQVWVCADHTFNEPRLIDRFAAIARQYPSCFGFNNDARRWLGASWGWIGKTNRRFWVDPASPAVCSTGLYQREGERHFIRTDHAESRLVCMGDVEFDYVAQDLGPQSTTDPRPCSDSEMRRYGFDMLAN